ncbi:hypothetical protein AERO8C_160296 [Aeromonas veronii]|uniref:Uncharacterized protein n=1 Tax=Aeromonas veronii TaxID=654 RepID=A0A653KZ62_AERVE|nr:hypothetical protein AERO8C_160296 [Aeromonas veronii]
MFFIRHFMLETRAILTYILL